MKKILFAGNVPYLSCLILAASTFYMGLVVPSLLSKSAVKVAFLEKGATVAEALLTTKYSTQDDLDREISKPIIAVIKKYVDKGYVVIDASTNENGAMEIVGIPKGSVNINNELRMAVKLPEITKKTPAPTTNSLIKNNEQAN